MAVTLRAVLAVLAGGFAAETFGSVYLRFGGGYTFDAAGLVLGLGPIVALAGVLILWTGRRKWSLLSGDGIHGADVTFGVSVLAIACVLGLVGWYGYEGASSLSGPILWGFAVAAWTFLFLTFATFALIVANYSGAGGRVVLGVALAWAAGVSGWMAGALALETGPILHAVETHSMQVASLVAPIASIAGYLAPTYGLLLVAYLGAIRRIPAASTTPGPLAGTPRPVE